MNEFQTARIQAYPAYRDTEISWLGKIPSHWTLLPGRVIYSFHKTPNQGMKENQVLSLSYGKIRIRGKEELHGLIPESFETYQVIQPGDIICRPTDLQNDWNSLRFGISRNKGIITSAYFCIRAKSRLHKEYAHRLLHTYDLKKVFYGLGSGLRQNLNWEDFKHLPCATPPLDEQAAIVRYLDAADQKIQAYISAKQKLIALLEEQRQAIIHQAVTRGLDPSVKLKPSGVKWLGEVPEHWEVLPGKACFLTRKQLNVGMQESTVLSLSYGRIRVRAPEKLHGLVPESFETYQIVDQKDIICRPTDLQNDWNSLRFGISPHRGIITSAYFCIKTSPLLNTDFGHMLLHTYDLRKIFYGLGSGLRQNLSWDDFKYLPCLIPPMGEQHEIVEHITQRVNRAENQISTVRRQIELMEEYRTRLIADVVTGKLDVRPD